MDAGACTGDWIPKRARKQLEFCEIPDDTGAGAGCDGSMADDFDMFEPYAYEPEGHDAFDHVVLNR